VEGIRRSDDEYRLSAPWLLGTLILRRSIMIDLSRFTTDHRSGIPIRVIKLGETIEMLRSRGAKCLLNLDVHAPELVIRGADCLLVVTYHP
jgi:hypothetical protein